MTKYSKNLFRMPHRILVNIISEFTQ
jgi:hypothetical protein